MERLSVKNNLGIPSAILIVISQLISGYQSSKEISSEILKFREEFQQSLIDRETYFVRKTELSQISQKIDRLNAKMIKMGEQLNSLKIEIYSSNETGNEIVGCDFRKANMAFRRRGL